MIQSQGPLDQNTRRKLALHVPKHEVLGEAPKTRPLPKGLTSAPTESVPRGQTNPRTIFNMLDLRIVENRDVKVALSVGLHSHMLRTGLLNQETPAQIALQTIYDPASGMESEFRDLAARLQQIRDTVPPVFNRDTPYRAQIWNELADAERKGVVKLSEAGKRRADRLEQQRAARKKKASAKKKVKVSPRKSKSSKKTGTGKQVFPARFAKVASVFARIDKIQTEAPLSQLPGSKKGVLLIVGPSGTGKTSGVKEISKFFGIPVAFTDATQFTQVGYQGQDAVATIANRLLAETRGDKVKAERGIVVIDELDKLRPSLDQSHDVGGKAVLQEILGLLENAVDEETGLDLSNVLIVLLGVFDGLTECAEKVKGGGMGFGKGSASESRYPEVLRGLGPEELDKSFEEWGFVKLSEMMGRIDDVVFTDKPTPDHMYRILTESIISPLVPAVAEMEQSKVCLEFSENALRYIAEIAARSTTHARMLKRIIEKVAKHIKFAYHDHERKEWIKVRVRKEDIIASLKVKDESPPVVQ